ncbi:MAG: tetratricopeptide repeat protein [Polymorphobacter sp.]
MASLATSQSEKASIAAFKTDVIDASLTALVLVDFWAEWCGPCKTLTPLLERVIATYAPRVRLVKIDVDKNQTLASQFRIESVPTVYAFIKGQPVDGFAGALGERELKTFIDRLLAAVPAAPAEADAAAQIEALAQAAADALAEGAAPQAEQMFAALVAEVPDRTEFTAGLARARVALGDLDGARAALAALPADARHATLAQARAALALAEQATPVADLAGLTARVEANPDDQALRIELAGGLMARGDRDAAAAALLESIRRDAGWNDGAARARLLTLFEAVGLSDPWVLATRRKLSTILFA